nr:glycosyltransferase [uncultured Acetatifactor sp.]
MEAVKVSIIVPIYNTKDYLEKCLYSVRVQSYRNIEVIMVDDGSTDGSADVCQQICMKDSRFHYYYQKNQGVSSARNYGIELAKGDLIAFVDSDDWIEADMYEKMVDLMLNNESDMVMCDAIIWEDGKRGKVDSIEVIKKTCHLDTTNITADILFQLSGAVWRCIYKSEIIKKNTVRFPVGLKLSEDRVFNIYCIGYSKKISYLKEGLYCRYIRNGSAVYQSYANMDKIALFAYQEIINALSKMGFISFRFLYDEQFLGTCYKAIDDIGSMNGKNHFIYKYNKIRNLCCTQEVKNVLVQTRHKYLKTRLMKKRMYLMLTLISVIKRYKFYRKV